MEGRREFKVGFGDICRKDGRNNGRKQNDLQK